MSRHEGRECRKLMDLQPADPIHGPMVGLLATSYELDPTFVETDLLPATLGLGAWDDRSWASRVALEKALAGLEATCILSDQRRYRGRPRSPHVEVLPAIGVGGQLLHAKVLLVVHERAVRLQLGSANLTGAGYRENREVVFPIVVTRDTPRLAALVRDALTGLPERLAPWWTDAAATVHRLALSRLDRWAGEPHHGMRVVWGGGSPPLWQQVVECWPEGERIERVSIVSPFWSEEGEGGPLASLISALRARAALPERVPVELYVDSEPAGPGTYRPRLPPLGPVHPEQLGLELSARAVDPRPSDDGAGPEVLKIRKLHAKVLVLHGSRWTLAYVGSANFTGPGWGFGSAPSRANIEAGVVLVRGGAALADAVLPPTTGKPVRIAANTALPPSQNEPEAAVPTFLRGIWLEPVPGDGERLRLAVRVEPGLVQGAFTLTIGGEGATELLAGDEAIANEMHLSVSGEVVAALLVEQCVVVRWWASASPVEYPVNVDLEARHRLPGAPGCPDPGERELLAYYQGRIPLDAVYRRPLDWEEGEGDPTARPDASAVDTSRIQSYRVREFVEALQGIRRDLAAAAKGTAANMRLAVQGPVSPLALARAVRAAASGAERSPTAAGFQLVELALCLKQAAEAIDATQEWRDVVCGARSSVQELLAQVVAKAPDALGPGTAFARYTREVLGWRVNTGGKEA